MSSAFALPSQPGLSSTPEMDEDALAQEWERIVNEARSVEVHLDSPVQAPAATAAAPASAPMQFSEAFLALGDLPEDLTASLPKPSRPRSRCP